MGKPKATLPGITAAAAARPATLNKATRQCFLDHLAATCHVQGAAGAAGASTSAFYKLRRGDPAFADAWRAAVQAGYDRIEEALLARAIKELDEYRIDEDAVVLELVEADTAGDVPGADGNKPPAKRGRAGLQLSAGLSGKVARVDIQLALTLLNRRAATDVRGRERHTRRRPSAEEVEKALTAKLDTLSRRLAAPDE